MGYSKYFQIKLNFVNVPSTYLVSVAKLLRLSIQSTNKNEKALLEEERTKLYNSGNII